MPLDRPSSINDGMSSVIALDNATKHRAQITVACHSLNATSSLPEALEEAALLLEALGLANRY